MKLYLHKCSSILCLERFICFSLSGKIHARTETIINDTQRSLLKQSFATEPYPSKVTYQKLSEQLGLKKTTVYNWFKSERKRIKKRKNQKLPKGKFMCL